MSQINAGINVTKFRIDSSTTASQLHEFLDVHAGDRTKLRGREVSPGVFEIYASNKDHTLGEKMSGLARQRNEAAAQGIAMVFKNTAQSFERLGLSGSHHEMIFGGLNDLSKIDHGKALRSDVMREASYRLARVDQGVDDLKTHTIATEPETRNEAAAKGPLVSFTFDGESIDDIVAGLRQPTLEDDVLVANLTTALETAIENAGLSSGKKDALALSGGDRIRAQLKDAVLTEFRTATGNENAKLSPKFETALKKAFDGVSDTLLGSGKVGEATVKHLNSHGKEMTETVPKLKFPDADGGSNTYTPIKYLGTGSNATVYLYRNDLDPTDTIAVKVQNADSPSSHGAFVREGLVHKEITQSDNPQILGLKGLAKFDGGRIAIAMEKAPNGTAYGLGKILNSDGAGGVTAGEKKVMIASILKESLEGLVALKDKNFVHKDYHGGNLLLASNGHVKIADFGTSEKGASNVARMLGDVDNKRTVAPEIQLANSKWKEASQQMSTDFKKAFVDIGKFFFPNSTKMEKAASKAWGMMSHIADEMKLPDHDIEVSVDRQDVFSLGTTAYKIFTGKDVCDDLNFLIDVEPRMIRLATDKTDPLIPYDPSDPEGSMDELANRNALGFLTGDKDVDDLLTGLLHPDPNKRLTPEDALKLPIFKTPGVGTDETFSKIAALTSPT